MTSAVSAVTAVYSTQTAMAKLALTEWLVTKAWQPFLDAKAQAKMADSLSVSPTFIFLVMLLN